MVAHSSYNSKHDALCAALDQYLKGVRPVWWKFYDRIGLKRRRGWVITSAFYDWPEWYFDALRCGADPDALQAIYMLVFGKAFEPKYRNPPY